MKVYLRRVENIFKSIFFVLIFIPGLVLGANQDHMFDELMSRIPESSYSLWTGDHMRVSSFAREDVQKIEKMAPEISRTKLTQRIHRLEGVISGETKRFASFPENARLQKNIESRFNSMRSKNLGPKTLAEFKKKVQRSFEEALDSLNAGLETYQEALKKDRK